MGFTQCNPKVDAFECVLINVDNEAKPLPLKDWFWFCVNKKTGAEHDINIADSDKCIRNNADSCKWIGTDINEREIILKEYKEQCKP